jgi:phosphatidylinositol-3-phosphatase
VKTAAAAALLVAVLAAGASAAPPRVPAFDHIIVIVFENKEFGSVLGNPRAPTFNAYARTQAELTHYYGVTHPSLPNYLALVSGSTHGIRTDCTSCVVSGPSLATTIEAAGRSWKVYAEGLPRPGFAGPWSGGYAKKHNPFMYFPDVSADQARRARVVPFTQLAVDLSAQQLPDFSLVVPNLCDSMHDCSVAVGDAWLRRTAPRLLTLPNSVVFVIFDEGATSARGGGRVPALALGTAVRPRARFAATTGHYGLLRTIEEAWGLPFLGRSARAAPITGIYRQG